MFTIYLLQHKVVRWQYYQYICMQTLYAIFLYDPCKQTHTRILYTKYWQYLMCMHNHQGECLRATNKKIGFLRIILGFVLLGYLVLYCCFFICIVVCTQLYQFRSICFQISTVTLIFIKCFAFIDMRINFLNLKGFTWTCYFVFQHLDPYLFLFFGKTVFDEIKWPILKSSRSDPGLELRQIRYASWHRLDRVSTKDEHNPSQDSSIGSISAWYRGGPRFKFWQGREFFS